MSVEDPFLLALQEETAKFNEAVATEQGDWIVKGFIDVYRRIYTVSVDTKVISKVMELLLFPKLVLFGAAHGYDVVLARYQNQYPDLSFVSKKDGTKYAVDIKSTYRKSASRVNGMTLGAFTGYFIDRNSTRTSTFAYNQYKMHLVLGILYSQATDAISEQKIYLVDGIKDDPPTDLEQNSNLYEHIDSLEKISSVVRDFTFFVQPKYRIASTTPGSGNTKNIGSVKLVDQLIAGIGPFAALGEEIYDDYWMYYVTKKEAREQRIARPYEDLKSYFEYKRRGLEKVDDTAISEAIAAEQVSETAEPYEVSDDLAAHLTHQGWK